MKNFLCRLFFWTPAVVHWTVVGLPALVCAGIAFAFGATASFVWMVGSFIFLYFHVFYPENMKPRSGNAVDMKTGRGNLQKKRVAVIGAGPAGLVTAKEIMAEGHAVEIFDACSRIGGVFANNFWPGGKLVSSPYITCFSDFEPARKPNGKEHWEHHTAEEYVQYLESYAKHFGVTEHIVLCTKVLHVFEDGNGTFLSIYDMKASEMKTVGPFDHVAVCSGSFHEKSTPKIAGLSSFSGRIFHTEDFAFTSKKRDMDESFNAVAGKRVVAVGLGESMADILGIITTRISSPTSYCAVSVRGGAFVIPRMNSLTGKNNDFDSTRFRYSLPKYIHNLTIALCTLLTAVFEFRKCDQRRIRFHLMKKIAKFGPAFVKTTKSDDFVQPIVEGKLEVKCRIHHIDNKTVYFEDGTIVYDVDVLIMGTGFSPPRFPFLDKMSYNELNDAEGNMMDQCSTTRFLRMFHPSLGAKLAFIGIGIRPLVGSIPTIAELQARLFALVVSGTKKLPNRDEMRMKVEADKKASRDEFATHNERWTTLVNWIPYMDTLAREIGCLPCQTWMLSRPNLCAKILFGPMSPYQYRLVGPGCKPEMAEDVLGRLPYGARKRDVIFYAGIHFTRALLAWPFFAFELFMSATSSMPPTTQGDSLMSEASKQRPPLVCEEDFESMLKSNPEETIKNCRKIYGDSFRFQNAGGRTTIVVCNQELANAALTERTLSFYEPSYQSKIRFGIKAFMKGPDDAMKLSQFFRKTLTGSKITKAFQQTLQAAFQDRFQCFKDQINESETFSLADLVSKTVFAANVDAIFGSGIYTPELYDAFATFSESVGHRSAPTKDNVASEFDHIDKARQLLFEVLHDVRCSENSSAAAVIKQIQPELEMNNEDADSLALLTLWGSNINLLPSTVWIISLLLKHQNVIKVLREESSRVEDIFERPRLEAAVAEALRLQSRPNMFRVATADCSLKYDHQSSSPKQVEVKKGEWVWLFPRSYLHLNEDFYAEPLEFKPFEHFPPAACPFRTGNPILRVFGGGTAPCPGKDYAVMMLKIAVDALLLSDRQQIQITLTDPSDQLPRAVTQSVASTPPPSKPIMVTVKKF